MSIRMSIHMSIHMSVVMSTHARLVALLRRGDAESMLPLLRLLDATSLSVLDSHGADVAASLSTGTRRI